MEKRSEGKRLMEVEGGIISFHTMCVWGGRGLRPPSKSADACANKHTCTRSGEELLVVGLLSVKSLKREREREKKGEEEDDYKRMRGRGEGGHGRSLLCVTKLFFFVFALTLEKIIKAIGGLVAWRCNPRWRATEKKRRRRRKKAVITKKDTLSLFLRRGPDTSTASATAI